jgi:hypothetical protein
VRKARLQALQRALHARITPTSPPESPP